MSFPTLEAIHGNCQDEGECLLWKGRFASGSPQFRIDGKYKMVRRIVHELTTGKPVKRKLHPVMTCRDAHCVKFEHMTLLTTKQVAQLAAKEGKLSTPQRCAAISAAMRKRGKLDEAIAREIRLSPESGPELAARHGVHRSLPVRIKSGEAWREAAPNSSVWSMKA